MSDVHSPRRLTRLVGTIRNYRRTRAEVNFVFTDSDRTALGVIAIAAGTVGLSGQAISTAANATGAQEMADFFEFDLNDKPVKGWVWRSSFKEGDAVKVAAEWTLYYFEVGGLHGLAIGRSRSIRIAPEV